MADQNYSCSSSATPVIITSTSEHIKSDVDDSSSLANSKDSKNLVEKNNFSSDENGSCTSPSSQSNLKLLFCDSTITSSSENRNGVLGSVEKESTEKLTSFLRPSILSGGFSSFASKNTETNKADSTFSLKSSKLTLTASKFGDASFTDIQKNTVKSMSSGKDKNETSNNLQNSDKNHFGNATEEKSNKPALGIFSTNLKLSSNAGVGLTPKTSAITVPDFVFGQNLHERVTDSVKSTNTKEETDSDNKSKCASDMLFTSVLTCQEVKDNINNEKFSHSKDSSSLIEDAARCQEARANKRKYEEVLVTTGEEGEQNILQINVKLFAFDNGTWIERGRGILRLNDKNSDEGTSSRIVIRTVGSLRVVLNTKIWSGMSLSRASERSARLTAIDPNGQVKIYLIQASLKDMTHLYPLIEDRIKLYKNQQESEESPKKKIALEKIKM